MFTTLWTAISLAAPGATASEWSIHEWGTFTSLPDESGRSIAGINTDDEPVPRFVHRLSHWVLLTPSEVPVIFFYLPLEISIPGQEKAKVARSGEVHRQFTAVGRGEKPLASMIEVPKTYRTYLDLGRFRNAFILEEAQRNPFPGLEHFINTYRLQAGTEAPDLQPE